MNQGIHMNKTDVIIPIQNQALKGRAKENFNFQEAAALLANYGFNCIRLTNDWADADFLADHIHGFTLRVQLKSRITISKKYEKTNPYILFPAKTKECPEREWFLIEHKKLIDIFKEHKPDALQAKAWIDNGVYHICPLPQKIRNILIAEKHLLGSVAIKTENELCIAHIEP